MSIKSRLDKLEKQHGDTEIVVRMLHDLTPEEKEYHRQRAKNEKDYIFVSLDWGDDV